jgi:hypothetical protein
MRTYFANRDALRLEVLRSVRRSWRQYKRAAIAAMLRAAGGPCEVILSDDDGWETVSDGEDDDEE